MSRIIMCTKPHFTKPLTANERAIFDFYLRILKERDDELRACVIALQEIAIPPQFDAVANATPRHIRAQQALNQLER